LVLGLTTQSVITLLLLPPTGLIALLLAATGVWKPGWSIAREIAVSGAVVVTIVMTVAVVAYVLPD